MFNQFGEMPNEDGSQERGVQTNLKERAKKGKFPKRIFCND